MSTDPLTAAVAGFSAEQIDKALQLIADGGIVETGFAREWVTVSSDGSTHYLTAPDTCQCRAALCGRRCYHQAAAAMLAAQPDKAA
jgi:hypothetical protein